MTDEDSDKQPSRKRHRDMLADLPAFAALMKAQGWDSQDLAVHAGVSQKTIERMLAGNFVRRDSAEIITRNLQGLVSGPLFVQSGAVKATQPTPAPVPIGSSLASALDLWDAGRLEEAGKLFRQIAEETGHPAALNRLGWMYQHGLGVTKDMAQAADWYRRAADANDPNGLANYAWMHHHGLGVPLDCEIARSYYLRAAEFGEGLAMNQLGWMFQKGQGVARDNQLAFDWYRRAAEAGDRNGLNNLGWMYEFGLGVTQDYSLAARYYRMSVERGNTDAEDSLRRVTALLKLH